MSTTSSSKNSTSPKLAHNSDPNSKYRREDHSVFGVERSTAKDRIKTEPEFKKELNELMKEHLKHKKLLAESKKCTERLKTLRSRVIPFMVHNMKMYRYDSPEYDMYLSSTVVSRFRKVKLTDVYTIIEKELGPANLQLIKEKAEELRKQKVQMRQTSFRPLSKKKRKNESKNDTITTLPKRTKK